MSGCFCERQRDPANRQALMLPRAPHLISAQYFSTGPKPSCSHRRPLAAGACQLAWQRCYLQAQGRLPGEGWGEEGFLPRGFPYPKCRSTSLGLCVRRVQGGEGRFLVCVPAGQGVGPALLVAPLSGGCRGSSSTWEILLLPESQLRQKINFSTSNFPLLV